MKKHQSVIFKRRAHEEYERLKTESSRTYPSNEQLIKSIDTAIQRLKHDPFSGDMIPQKHITKAVVERYDTNKVFRMELVGYWRLLYTVSGDQVSIIAFILEFMDHDTYNKLFRYRKK